MSAATPLFRDDQASPPDVPEEPLYDEEPRQQAPGSWLEALPQFFVFPLILVITLTAVYLLLRMLAGVEPESAVELLREARAAGPHARWQVLQSLADGINKGQLTLDDVPADELAALYESWSAEAALDPQQGVLLDRYLLPVMARKGDPSLTPYAVDALGSDDPQVRQLAFEALGTMADPDTVDLLAGHLQEDDPDSRLLALGALANIDTPEVHDLLAGQMQAEDTVVARNAVLLLAQAGDARATPFLVRMLDRASYAGDPQLEGPDRAQQGDASRAAVRDGVVEAFLEKSCRAAEALGDPALVPALTALREGDPSVGVRSAAINALHTLGEKQ